jgi:hypothetical protein
MPAGGGFAGFHAARALSRHAMGLDVEVVLINPTDYFLYLPLLPEVAAGILDPRRVTVPLAATLPRVRLVLGTVDGVALGARRVEFLDPEGQRRTVAYDRLLLDLAPRVLPELDRRLGAAAGRVLRQREVEVRLQTTVHLMILVTGATGQTGRPLVAELLRRGAAVRALVWDPSAARPILGPDVELVEGDLERPNTLDAALQGAEQVYLLTPPHPRLAAMEVGVIHAARRAGVCQVVKHSAIDASPAARPGRVRLADRADPRIRRGVCRRRGGPGHRYGRPPHRPPTAHLR